MFGDDGVGLGEEESTGVGVAAGDPVGGQLGVIGGGRVRGLRDGCSSMVEYAKVVGYHAWETSISVPYHSPSSPSRRPMSAA